MFEIKKDKTKICILGTGDGWQLAPKVNTSIVYGLNDYIFAEKYGIKIDYLFIMDILDEKPQIVSGINNLKDVITRINKFNIPFISPFVYDEIPLSQAFPLEQAYKEFGMLYFSNTIAYMICFAILNGAKEIELFGVNQASSSEYFYEKAGIEYWLGIANGRNIKIIINGDKSEVLGNKKRFGGNLLYGYNQTYEEIQKINEKYGTTRIKKLTAPMINKSRTIRTIN